MRKLSLIVCLTILTATLAAQDGIFNLEDLFTNGNLYPQRMNQWQWLPQSSDFIFVRDNAVMRRPASSAKAERYFTLEDVNAAMKAAGKDAFRRFPSMAHWVSPTQVYIRVREGYALYDVSEKRIVHTLKTTVSDASNILVDWDHARFSYTIGDNLFVCKADGQPVRVDKDGAKDVRYGHVPHRNEFGIEQGAFWSPKGNCLAFYRMDESMVTDYPLVDAQGRIATLKNVKYPMAGMTSHEVTVGVYNMATGKTVYLQTGEPRDHFLCSVTWTPDERYLLVAVLNREQNHLELNRYDAETGALVGKLFEESNSRYVEPSDPLYFLPNQPDQFVYVSRRDGWKHLYLYDISGKLLKQLTSGNWEVKSFEGFDRTGTKIFFTSNKDEIPGERFYVLDIKKGKITDATPEDGTHSVQPDATGSWFLDVFSTISQESRYVLRDKKGNVKEVLLDNKGYLSDYMVPETRIFTLKNGNNDDLYCRLIYPPMFDSTKKYPVFYYVYGGPHSQLVTNNWLSGGWFLQYMAQKGYLVFTMDNRGTNYRGFEFESCIHRHLGDYEVEDQMCGVNYLRSLPYADTSRFSIDGWSYGGFMTLSLFTRYPGIFKKATAGGPVIDWKYYEVMYGERYMDMPQENPEGYEKASLLNRVDSIQGKLLIFHGAQDATVVWQHTLQFITQCITKGKQVDYFIYPTHEHNVSGFDRTHLWKKIEEFHSYGK